MRFFFQFTTLNHRIRHEVAVALSKLYPGSTFAATISSNGQEIQEFLSAQKDIRYEFTGDFRDVIAEALKQEIDLELLRWFESTLPEKSLWRILAVDREWCYHYLDGKVLFPQSFTHTITSNDNILRVACGFLRLYKKVMTEFKPDVVVAAAGQNNMSCPISDHMCKIFGVLYMAPETIRTRNYMAFTDNRQCTFDHVNDTYRKLFEGSLSLDTSKGQEIYDEIIKDLYNSQYFDSPKVDHFKSGSPLLSFLSRSARSVLGQTRKWIKEGPKRRDARTLVKPADTWQNFLYSVYLSVVQHYRRVQLLDPSFYSQFDPKTPYIYFPLHITNEYSTQVQGTMWIDQLMIIEALSKSIPAGWKLVVKEHPAVLLCRIRTADFYKRIKNLPNVDFIPVNTNTHVVISSAQMVATIIGTTGWEAVIRGKPVISFEENMFDVLGLSRRCTDFKELSKAIHEERQRIAKISADERRRRIIFLLTAIHEHSFSVDNPLHIIGEAECENPDERRSIGEVIAKAMSSYLKFRGIKATGDRLPMAGKNDYWVPQESHHG